MIPVRPIIINISIKFDIVESRFVRSVLDIFQGGLTG